MCWLFGLTVLTFRGDRAKNAELLVLRLENAVLRRNAGRVRYEPADRVWFTVLTPVHPAQPLGGGLPGDAATLAWHRRLARKYDTSKRRRPGQPKVMSAVDQHVVEALAA